MHDPSVLAGLAELTGVQMLWFAEYYDGPVDGLARYGDREYWFIAIAEDQGTADDLPRRYVLHAISDRQAQVEWEDHRGFTKVVGGPGCLHVPPCPRGSGDSEAVRQWYRDHAWDEVRSDYSNAPAVGWFRV